MPITKAIVFVIDSAQLNKLLRPTAEYLYQVLTNTHTLKSEIPIIMLCNKSDVLTALSKERCATVLESEL